MQIFGKNSWKFLAGNSFLKKAPSQILKRVPNTLLTLWKKFVEQLLLEMKFRKQFPEGVLWKSQTTAMDFFFIRVMSASVLWKHIPLKVTRN